MTAPRVRVSADTLGTGFHYVQLPPTAPESSSRNLGISPDGSLTLTLRREELRDLRDILATLDLEQ